MAKLHINRLSEMTDREAIWNCLHTLPKTLVESYRMIIERIRGQPHNASWLGMRILMWLIYAMAPLRSRELQHIIFSTELKSDGLDFDNHNLVGPDFITSVCHGFVVVDEESDIVRFTHLSVQDYLETEEDKLFPEGTDEITRSCIRYLSLDPFTAGPCPNAEIRDRVLKYPFATYAAQYWVQHAKQKQEALTNEVINEVARFLTHGDILASWIQILAFVEGQASSDSPAGDGETEGEPTLSARLAKCSTPLEAAKVLGLDMRVSALIDSRAGGP